MEIVNSRKPNIIMGVTYRHSSLDLTDLIAIT